MNRKIILITLILLQSSLFAQNSFKIGIVTGLNISHLYNDNIHPNSENKIGFMIGGITTFSLSNDFSIIGELYYSMKGQKNDPAGEILVGANEGKFSISKNYSYLSFPILINYKVTEIKKLGITIETGVEFSNLIGAEWDFSNSTSSSDVKDITEDFDVGIVAGTKIFIPVPKRNLFLGFRYIHGLNKVNTYGTIKNRVLSIYTGYLFNL